MRKRWTVCAVAPDTGRIVIALDDSAGFYTRTSAQRLADDLNRPATLEAGRYWKPVRL